MNTTSGLNATFAAAMARPGNVAFLSQSGALCTAVLDWSLRENGGFSHFISVGSMLDVDWGDLIYYLGDDPRTNSIVMYMETIGNARSFMCFYHAWSFDTRGRLWVVECLSYPKWRADGKGGDRVVILEDTDSDGVHDKRTVFLENGSNLSGIEVGFGGVWLCSIPNLIFVPDRDGDDKPDGPPEVLLDGWNFKDTKHNIFNSLAWGPDGWLYGCNGIQSRSLVGKPGTPDAERVRLDCGVWRYHPTQKRFELYASGTTNPFGLDWDENGHLFITNCVIHHLWHVIPGGHMQRMYGDDVNPFVFGYQTSCADHLHWGGGAWTTSRSTGAGGSPAHSEAGGGHAHSGAAIYLGDNFPAEYRNSLFTCNIHGNRLNRDKLERTPSGYVGKHAPDFLFANDSWFRGIAARVGPDGGLYVSDWTDTGECHNYDVADSTNGRVFKVVHGTPQKWSGDVAKLSDDELMKLAFHKNDWFVRQARRVLQERAAAGKLGKETPKQLAELVKGTPDVAWKLRAMWAAHVTGALTPDLFPDLLAHDDDDVRAWAMMLATDGPTPAAVPAVLAAVEKEESPFALHFAAGVSQRLPNADGRKLARLVEWRILDTDEPNLALAGWYAVQKALAGTDREADWNDFLEHARHPLIGRNIARYLVGEISEVSAIVRTIVPTRPVQSGGNGGPESGAEATVGARVEPASRPLRFYELPGEGNKVAAVSDHNRVISKARHQFAVDPGRVDRVSARCEQPRAAIVRVSPCGRIDDCIAVAAQSLQQQLPARLRQRQGLDVPAPQRVVAAGADQPLGIRRVDQQLGDPAAMPVGGPANERNRSFQRRPQPRQHVRGAYTTATSRNRSAGRPGGSGTQEGSVMAVATQWR